MIVTAIWIVYVHQRGIVSVDQLRRTEDESTPSANERAIGMNANNSTSLPLSTHLTNTSNTTSDEKGAANYGRKSEKNRVAEQQTSLSFPVVRPPVYNNSTINQAANFSQKRQEVTWPPLLTLLDNVEDVKKANVTGDVKFLMDFAIIGYPKMATSFVMRWLA